MIEFGFFSLCLGFIFSIYAFISSFLSFNKPFVGLVSSSRNAILATFLCLLLSSFILWNSLLLHDFSLQYVYEHSSTDMPPWYLLTSFWSALEGSHLLWTLLLSFWISVSLIKIRKENEFYLPALNFIYSLCLMYMLLLNVTFSAPFNRLFPVGSFGKGMNSLLQNPYMAIHPPILFNGYSVLVIPFANSIAALIYKKITPEWIISVRNYSLIAFGFLLLAITLGGKWAYMELGWGGYWAWDPVENSSFLPLLSTIAAIHSYIMYKKTNHLPRLALFLSLFAFILTFEGTFLTRSGVISSVHSFAQSDIGPVYLSWIFLLCILSFGLLFSNGQTFIHKKEKLLLSQFSRETVFIFFLFYLLFMLGLVLIGTALPIIIDALTGTRISIQQPFYNTFAPWIGLGIVLLLGIGNLMKWKKNKIEKPIQTLMIPFIVALIVTLFIFIKKSFPVFSFFIYLAALWQVGILISDLYFKIQKNNYHPMVLIKHNRGYLGSVIVHIGFLFLILGFVGNDKGKSVDVNFNLNEKTIFQNYEIKYSGMKFDQQYNEKRVVASVSLHEINSNKMTFLVSPQKTKFSNSTQWFNEVGVYSTLWYDIYIVLASFDPSTDSVTLKINYNPTVKIVWTSILIMLLGIIVCLTHKFKPFQIQSHREELSSNSKNETEKKNKIQNLFLILFFIGVAFFGLSGNVFAQENSSTHKPYVTSQNEKFEDISKELRCPTCQGMSITESETPQSQAMRAEVQRLIQSGKNKEQILDYFKERYGPWILRSPDPKSTLGFLVWLFPTLIFILGPMIILIKMKLNHKNQLSKKTEIDKKMT